MTPVDLCRAVYSEGVQIRADGSDLVLAPAGRLPTALRELLLTHKPELIDFLHEAEHTVDELVRVSMLACDYHEDGDKARADMRADMLAIPPHQHADLIKHFKKSYGERP